MGKADWRTMRSARLRPRRRGRSLVAAARARLAHRMALIAARRAAQRALGGHAAHQQGNGVTETKEGGSLTDRTLFPEGFVHRFRCTVNRFRKLSSRCSSP